MEPQLLWMHLNELAARLGVEVRLESLGEEEGVRVKGGLCRIGGRMVAFVDRGLRPMARARQLAMAIRGMELEAVYVKPALRDFLDELGEEPADRE